MDNPYAIILALVVVAGITICGLFMRVLQLERLLESMKKQATPLPMPGMSTAGAAYDAMEPTPEEQPALSWIDKLEQEINGK